MSRNPWRGWATFGVGFDLAAVLGFSNVTLTGCPAFGCPDEYRHLSLDDKIITCLQTGRRVPVYSTHALAEIASVDDDAINGRRIGPELVESSGLDLADFQLASDLALKW